MSLLGVPVVGISAVLTGLITSVLLPPPPAFSFFHQVTLVSWRGDDAVPWEPWEVPSGSTAPMFYTTASPGAHEAGGAGILPTGVWAPGDQVSRKLILRNRQSNSAMQLEHIEAHLTGDVDILPFYNLTVTSAAGTLLWSGSLQEFLGATMLPLALPVVIPGQEERELTFTVALDLATGNPFQGKTIQADFLLHAASMAGEMAIDIHPTSWPNPVSPTSSGSTPVAVNGQQGFDVRDLDWQSARFGPDQAIPLGAGYEDWNHDGYEDLVLHFATQQTGVECGMTSMALSITSESGVVYQGSDAIITPGCK